MRKLKTKKSVSVWSVLTSSPKKSTKKRLKFTLKGGHPHTECVMGSAVANFGIIRK